MKIQVKATKIRNGAIACKLRSTNNWQNKKYKEGEIDCFGFYDYETKKGYIIKLKDTEGKSEIKMRIEKPKNGQTKNIRYAQNYIHFE